MQENKPKEAPEIAPKIGQIKGSKYEPVIGPE